MDYTLRQQEILASYSTEQQKATQELIFDKANELGSIIKGLPLEHRVRVVKQLMELNRSYWSDRQTRSETYDVFASTLQKNLERWQWLQSMHEEVIGELELLAAGQAVPVK